jgi:hypothetical protein
MASFAEDMRPMPAAHGPNAAFVSRPTRFQGRQATAPEIKHVKTLDMTEDDGMHIRSQTNK